MPFRERWTWLLLFLLLVSLQPGCTAAPSAASADPPRRTVSDLPLTYRGPREQRLYQLLGKKATIVLFMSSECPCCDSYRARIKALAEGLKPEVRLLALDENQVSRLHPDRDPDRLSWSDMKVTLVPDDHGRLARHFGAQVTPEVYLLDGTGGIWYHGDIDDNELEPGKVSRHYLQDALRNFLAGRPIAQPETEPTGCFITVEP